MRKKEKINAPKIRFDGFDDDWEQRNILEICKVFIGLVTTMTENYRKTGTLLIRNSDIKENKFKFIEQPIHLDESFAERNNSRRLSIGDVITVHTGDVGTSAVITEKEKGAIGFATINSRPNPEFIDSEYLATFLNTERHKNYAVKMSTGDGRSNYNLKDFNRLIVPVPTLEEQIKIGEFFKKIENTIALHQEKLNNLKLMKKAFLQVLFPQMGETEPRVRFANFDSKWEQRKLKDIADFNPKSNLPEQFEYVDLESVVGTELISHRTENKDTAPSRAKRLAQKGDVFFQTVRPYQKNNYLFDLTLNNYVFSTGYAQLRPKVDSHFLLSRIQEERFISSVLDRSTGTSYPAINSNDLAQIEVDVPLEKTEQTKMGILFKKLDDVIALYQTKLEKLQSLKKAYLHKMFI